MGMNAPISALSLAGLSNPEKARLIWTQAKADMGNKIWQAAFGQSFDASANLKTPCIPQNVPNMVPTLVQKGTLEDAVPHVDMADAASEPSIPTAELPVELGPNERYRKAIERAAARTDIPGTTLASIINAEAGKLKGGGWNCYSRNSRSSAAGLGQFLSATWVDMAERRGSWLNVQARRKGFLGANGKVTSASRAALLALRYDPEASIQAIADYSRANVDRLKAAGIRDQNIGKLAYMAHYMGPGDTIRFMRGQMSNSRAQVLLSAQIGSAEASRRIARSGSALAAHSVWLESHIGRNFRLPDYVSRREV